ncbi:hypothetical protein AVEN_110687-1 [Araneus ventricosus]|uniref:Uncharacterized protein n=1 Tax=Araneus ventricosus TaxID=182803 RepID=A0A4Y2AV27_ARAVE|nr:hypothetical protein AVEN_110687-1 [Araneus ventricosus]
MNKHQAVNYGSISYDTVGLKLQTVKILTYPSTIYVLTKNVLSPPCRSIQCDLNKGHHDSKVHRGWSPNNLHRLRANLSRKRYVPSSEWK